MSNITSLNNMNELVSQVQPDFQKLAEVTGAVHFEREAAFSMQLLKDNSYLLDIASKAPDSLKTAVLNVAAIGLTLNPVHKFAYLVPRDKKVRLDISYRGLIQIACEIGSIKWAKAELVYEKDKFVVNGMGQEPIHTFQPFDKNRGDLVGGYCVAKTQEDEFLVSTMTLEEIYQVRNSSVSWKAHLKDNKKSTPWKTFESEMIKKTVIKRAYKSWPLVNKKTYRLDEAVNVINDNDPMDFKEVNTEEEAKKHNQLVQHVAELLNIKNKSEEAFIDYMVKVHQRSIDKIKDLTKKELEQAATMIASFPDPKPEFPAVTEGA